MQNPVLDFQRKVNHKAAEANRLRVRWVAIQRKAQEAGAAYDAALVELGTLNAQLMAGFFPEMAQGAPGTGHDTLVQDGGDALMAKAFATQGDDHK